jgi:hypothetical protein
MLNIKSSRTVLLHDVHTTSPSPTLCAMHYVHRVCVSCRSASRTRFFRSYIFLYVERIWLIQIRFVRMKKNPFKFILLFMVKIAM